MTAPRGAAGRSPRCVARSRASAMHPAPRFRTSRSCAPQRQQARLPPRAGSSGSSARRLALSWPIILANVAINVMTVTDIMMLGWLSPHALAAGALGFQPLPAPIPAWHRHRRGALPDRRREGRGRRRRGSVAPRDPPGASLRAHHCARHLAGPVAHLEHPQGDRRRARPRRRRRNLYARVPVEPRAQPAVLCRARGVFCPRASPARADRRPRGGRVQRARQLRAHLRQAGGAGARHFWLGARDHAFPDADGPAALRGLAPR